MARCKECRREFYLATERGICGQCYSNRRAERERTRAPQAKPERMTLPGL